MFLFIFKLLLFQNIYASIFPENNSSELYHDAVTRADPEMIKVFQVKEAIVSTRDRKVHWFVGLIKVGYILIIQGEPLKSTPPKLSKYKTLYNLWHLEIFWDSFDGILDLERLGGVDFSGSPCRGDIKI